jgi:hypothetical protein
MIQSIGGWHHPADFFSAAEILENILSKQKPSKEINFVEIGIYNGRSFLPVSHYFYDKITSFTACDIFYEPIKLETFNRHLKTHLPSGYEQKIRIIKEDSLKLDTHFPVSENLKKFIYCSIDAHHGYAYTLSDLKFCADRMDDDGIIILDDVFQFTWPEVSNAMYDFLREYKQFSVAFILFNKVILCKNRRIVDDLYSPDKFDRQHINGEVVNIIKDTPQGGLKGLLIGAYYKIFGNVSSK